MRACRRLLPTRPSLTNSAPWGRESRVPRRRGELSNPAPTYPRAGGRRGCPRGPNSWAAAPAPPVHLGLADPVTPGARRTVPPPGPNRHPSASAKVRPSPALGTRPRAGAPCPCPRWREARPPGGWPSEGQRTPHGTHSLSRMLPVGRTPAPAGRNQEANRSLSPRPDSSRGLSVRVAAPAT